MSVERNNPTLPIRVFADAFIIVSKKAEGLKAPGYLISRLFRRFILIVLRSSLTIRHAEFSSASVRGEGRKKARGEILKQVQDDGRLAHYSQLIAHRSQLKANYSPP